MKIDPYYYLVGLSYQSDMSFPLSRLAQTMVLFRVRSDDDGAVHRRQHMWCHLICSIQIFDGEMRIIRTLLLDQELSLMLLVLYSNKFDRVVCPLSLGM